MSGRNRTYNRNADRLREKLAERNQPEGGDDNDKNNKHPAGLRGSQIGLWYKRRDQERNKSGENERKLASFFQLILRSKSNISNHFSFQDQTFHFPKTELGKSARQSTTAKVASHHAHQDFGKIFNSTMIWTSWNC